MKRINLIIILFFALTIGYGQETVLTFKNENVSRRTSKDSYSLPNKANGDLAIVMAERKELFVSAFNSNFELQASFNTNNVKPKYNKVLGYSFFGNTYHILYTNEKRSKFSVLSLDLKTKSGSINEIETPLGEDIFLEALNYNNELYILSANKKSKLTLRKFDNSETFTVLKIFALDEITEDTSLISNKLRMGLFTIVGTGYANITKIDHHVPTSIELSSNENKFYQNNEYVYLTFDSNEEATILYSINLKTLGFDVNVVPYPQAKIASFKKFNSFVYDGKLFQIASSKEEMKFVVKSFNGDVLKEYYLNKDLPIKIKNSPIIQEGQTALPFVTTRTLEQTRKYLRKISSGSLGITVIKNKDDYYITLGGFEKIYSGGVMPVVTTSNGASFVSYNPTYINYTSYIATKSTYFNSIFNADFEHKKGKLEKNIFDKISNYKKDKKYLTAEDIFILNNEVYFGYFNLKEAEYNLVKF